MNAHSRDRRPHFRLFILFFILLSVLALTQGSAFATTDAAEDKLVADVSLTAEAASLPADRQNVEVAVDQAVYIELGTSPDAELVMLNTTIAQGWSFGTIGISALSVEDASPEGLLFLARYDKLGWNVALEHTPKFRAWVVQAPEQLVSADERRILAPTAPTGDGSAQLSLPWATGETWTLTGGPHPNDGATNSRPRSALDFAVAGRGDVRAARDGIAYLDCANFIRINHDDGWQTGYYHISDIAVANGQPVSRGTYLGKSSTAVGCGGSATGDHQHFTLRRNGAKQEISGRDIGGWTVQEGAQAYSGCLTKAGSTQCASSGRIYNDGTIGSGGGQPPPTSTPGSTQLCNVNADQIALYSDTSFRGACVVLGIGQYPNPGTLGPVGNDNTRSIRVGGNVNARLYANNDFGGWEEGRGSDDSDLTNDTISNGTSSVRVERKPITPTNTPESTQTCNINADQVVLYSRTNFTGDCVVLGIGEYPNPGTLGAVGNDNTRSIQVGGNVKARLYADDNFSGWEEGRDGDDPDLTNDTINSHTSSVRVERRDPAEYPLQLYDAWHYEGGFGYVEQPGDYYMGSVLDDKVSALRLKSGWSVRLFEASNNSGTSVCLTSSNDDFGGDTFEDGSPLNDRASSFSLYQQATCPSIVPTSTNTPPPTNTYTAVPTNTYTPSPTHTLPPTITLTPTITPTPIPFVPCPRNDGYYSCDQSQQVNYTPVDDLVPAAEFMSNDVPDRDDGTAVLNLPFDYSFYSSPVLTVAVSTNGNLQFGTNFDWFSNQPLPTGQFDKVIAPYWDDLDLRQSGNVYTGVLGSAPNRVFVVEWRAVHPYNRPNITLTFAVKLYEGQERLSIEYIDMNGDSGSSATSGIQKARTSNYLLYSFNQNVLSTGRRVDFVHTVATVEPTSTYTASPTHTATYTPSPTNTALPPVTQTVPPCTLSYSDVAADSPFYAFISDLYCRGIIDGYPDNTFRWTEDVTRVTLARWIVKARGWSFDLNGAPHFSDVPAADPNYVYVETAFNHSVLSGYAPSDCPGGSAACFKPDNKLTRGQMSKMVVNAMGWPTEASGTPHFNDVQEGNPFYNQIETIFRRGIVSGYDLPGGGYEFRWVNNLTRGQLSKVLSNSVAAPALAGQPAGSTEKEPTKSGK